MRGTRVLNLRFKVIYMIVLAAVGLVLYIVFEGPYLMKSWNANRAFTGNQIKGIVGVGLAVLFVGVYGPVAILLEAKRRAQYASELAAPQAGDADVMTWARRCDGWVISRGLFWFLLGLGMVCLAVTWPWEPRAGWRFVLGGLGPICTVLGFYDAAWRWKIVIDRREKKVTVEWGFFVPLQWRTYDLTLYNRVVCNRKYYKAVRYSEDNGPDYYQRSGVKYSARIEGGPKPIPLDISYGCSNNAQMMMRPEEVAKFLGFEYVLREFVNSDG